MTGTRDMVLTETLRLLVPLHVDDLRHATVEQRLHIAHQAATVIGAQGDILQYGGGRKGEITGVFNALARGLAAAAYQPGGVTFHGVHWCTGHAECEAAEVSAQGGLEPKPPRPTRPVATLELPA